MAIAALTSGVHAHEHDPVAIREQIDESVLTCSSAIRLQNVGTSGFINSQNVKMNNMGSGQQIVTTVKNADSYDSLWTVKESNRSGKMCKTGAPIKCGDIVRFEHNNTGKNLHSHSQYKAALSNR